MNAGKIMVLVAGWGLMIALGQTEANEHLVFEDGFETGTVNGTPLTSEPSIGTWDFMNWHTGAGELQNEAPGIMFIRDATNPADPGFGAAYGSNYLEINPDPAPRPYANALLSSPGGNGDVVRVNLTFRTVAEFGLVRLVGDAGGAGLLGTSRYADIGSVLVAGPNSTGWGNGYNAGQVQVNGAYQPTLSHNPSIWNTLAIEYSNGASSMKVTINGVSVTQAIEPAYFEPSNGIRYNIGPGIVRAVSVGTGYNGSIFYADGFSVSAVVPEPATLVLLALGGLLTSRRFRRR